MADIFVNEKKPFYNSTSFVRLPPYHDALLMHSARKVCLTTTLPSMVQSTPSVTSSCLTGWKGCKYLVSGTMFSTKCTFISNYLDFSKNRCIFAAQIFIIH